MLKKNSLIFATCFLGMALALASLRTSVQASAANSIYIPAVSRASPVVLTDVRPWSTRCCLIIKGLATNLSGSTTFSVEIEGTFQDLQTGRIFKRSAYVYLPAILPGQTSPFSIMYFDYTETFISADVSGYSIPDQKYVPLTIVSRTWGYCDLASVNITGVVRNDSGVPVDMLVGAIWRFDDPSWWYHVMESIGFVPTTLQPGEETTYSAGQIYCVGPPPDEELQYYTIVVQGRVIP